MKKNIVLIGMPGAGKSTIGVLLAKVLGMDFIDSDLVIQKQDGRLLSRIIEEEGTDGFIKIEEQINAGLVCQNCVIATGGSAVYGKKAMESLKENGLVLYIFLPYETVKNRVLNVKGRGVVIKEGQTLKDVYVERSALYEKYADITVDASGLSLEETLAAVLMALKD